MSVGRSRSGGMTMGKADNRYESEPIPGLLVPREAGGTHDGSHFPSFRAPACRVIALVESSSSRAIGDPGPFEVWIADQSDTRPGFGGQLLIYRGADLMGGPPGGPSRSSGSIWVAPPPTCAVRPRDRRPCERQDACSFRFSRADDSHYKRVGGEPLSDPRRGIRAVFARRTGRDTSQEVTRLVDCYHHRRGRF